MNRLDLMQAMQKVYASLSETTEADLFWFNDFLNHASYIELVERAQTLGIDV